MCVTISVVISFAGCCTGVKDDLFTKRKYDDTAWMLWYFAGFPVQPCTIRSISFSLSLSVFIFVIILYIPKRCLIRQCTNRSGTKRHLRRIDFRIFVCITLIISREVQVDISSLFPLNQNECLKRDVETVFYSFFSTHQTDRSGISIPQPPANHDFFTTQSRCLVTFYNNNEGLNG